ncbi:hypothetical protein BGZ65_007460, partial [Modicella reniformis]
VYKLMILPVRCTAGAQHGTPSQRNSTGVDGCSFQADTCIGKICDLMVFESVQNIVPVGRSPDEHESPVRTSSAVGSYRYEEWLLRWRSLDRDQAQQFHDQHTTGPLPEAMRDVLPQYFNRLGSNTEIPVLGDYEHARMVFAACEEE